LAPKLYNPSRKPTGTNNVRLVAGDAPAVAWHSPHWHGLRSLSQEKVPDLPESGAVLAAVQDAARRARGVVAREEAAMFDCGSARRPGTV